MPGYPFFFHDSGPSRLGIVAGKKLGKSHHRNKIRRRIREIVRFYWGDIPSGVDLVVVTKSPAARAGFESLQSEFVHLAKKGGLLR